MRLFILLSTLVFAGTTFGAASLPPGNSSAIVPLASRIQSVLNKTTESLKSIAATLEKSSTSAGDNTGTTFGATLVSGLTDASGVLTTCVASLEAIAASTGIQPSSLVGTSTQTLIPFLTTISSMINSATDAVSVAPALGTTVAPLASNITTTSELIVIASTNTTILTDTLIDDYKTWSTQNRSSFNAYFNKVRQAIWEDASKIAASTLKHEMV